MGFYVTPEDVLRMANEKGFQYGLIPGKKVMFQGRVLNGAHAGKSSILCTPQAKQQDAGFFWVDLTSVQCELLNSCGFGLVVFRKEGGGTTWVEWDSLKRYLTTDCMKYNKNEGNHWKLNIYPGYIKISGNSNRIELVKGKHSNMFENYM